MPVNTAVLDAAMALHSRGFNVVPIGEGKRPPFSWKHLQEHPATARNVYEWFVGNPYWGLGVLTGASSGNLLMVEIEGRAAQSEEQLREFAYANGYRRVWDQLSNGWVERTPSGGTHFYVRCTQPIEGNKKLARRPLTDEERLAHPGQRLTVLAETRGEGGLSVVAPTPGILHPTGKPWELLRGSGLTCPTFTPAEIEAVYAIFASIDQTPKPAGHQVHVQRAHTPTHREGERLSTFDDYENRTSWEDILIPAGWSVHHQDSTGTVFWTRPGKNPTEGVSATTGHAQTDRLYVFSTSTEFDTERPYSKSQAYALLHHGGDLSQAAKDLYAQGYGERFPTRARPDTPKRANEKKPPRTLTVQEERSEMASEALRRVSASLRRPNPNAISQAPRTPSLGAHASFSTALSNFGQTR